jgi:hypothetical protein
MAYTTIDKPDQYFNTLTYTGNGTSGRSVTGVGFQPDWVWIKNRSDADPHKLFDVVRGVGKSIKSNSSDAEVTNEANGYVSAFGTDGFTLTAGSSSIQDVNLNNENYVSWNWRAGGSASSNSDGSITSSVSANTIVGFSVVSYTGVGAARTIGHGLGATPTAIIVKNRGSADDWAVWHNSLAANQLLNLNQTSAVATNNTVWNSTLPTSSVFSVGNDIKSGQAYNYIAYCFTDIKGYSKCGAYTGNGATDGPFVWTGFKPAFVLVKVTSTSDSWQLIDNKRDPENSGAEQLLQPDLNVAEATDSVRFDMLSNGLKMRTSNVSVNSSGSSYIYMAFAENPFVTSGGVPTTAR